MELSVVFFDALHLDGTGLTGQPDSERHAALARVVPGRMLMPRLVTSKTDEATAFFDEAIARGHEGWRSSPAQDQHGSGLTASSSPVAGSSASWRKIRSISLTGVL